MKKRANGEGSISKRKDGRWCGRYFVNTAEGRKRVAVYGKTRGEVGKKITAALSSSGSGFIVNTENPTLEAFLRGWLAGMKGTVKPLTHDSYSRLVNNHIVPGLGAKRKIKSIQPVHVQQLYSSKLASGLSGRTVQLIHTALHSAFKQAVAWKMVPENVTKLAKVPKAKTEEIQPLTATQAHTLIDVSSGSRLEALYIVAIHCGLRKGELLGLRWDDVDLEGGVLSVRRQLVRSSEGLGFSAPKNKRARTVSLSIKTANALAAHKANLAQEKLLAKDGWPYPELVFPTTTGTPMSPENLISRSFKPLLKKANLPNIRFHDLRHTCATLLLSRGEHPKVVQDRLGHASIAITMDIYSHVLPVMQRGAATTMDAIFDGLDAESA